MSEKERPLPEPQKSAFGSKRRYEEGEPRALMADEIARAAAEGRLEDFLRNEVPDNDYARSLVSMMMGMTGMAPVANPPDAAEGHPAAEEGLDTPEAPPDVVAAVRAGDVRQLTEILQKEYDKRYSGEGRGETEEARRDMPQKPTIERDVLDSLVRIASDNDVSLDWLTLRALKLYVQEYKRTGRL